LNNTFNDFKCEPSNDNIFNPSLNIENYSPLDTSLIDLNFVENIFNNDCNDNLSLENLENHEITNYQPSFYIDDSTNPMNQENQEDETCKVKEKEKRESFSSIAMTRSVKGSIAAKESMIEMLNRLKNDLESIDEFPDSCLNKYCKKKLAKRDGKYFCRACREYFQDTGESRKKRNISFVNGPTRSKVKNKMLDQFKDDLRSMDEFPTFCRNKYCNRPLTKNRGKHFCHACYISYLEKGKLRGKKIDSYE
jgi:hypothetical protein